MNATCDVSGAAAPSQEERLIAANQALAGVLRFFMPKGQIAAIGTCLRGEERFAMADVVLRVEQVVRSMPKSYETDGQGGQALVLLHYFRGSVDAWITERDKGDTPEGEEVGAQLQAFGKITLTGHKEDAELGYISIAELIAHGVELDLYWTPVTIGALS